MNSRKVDILLAEIEKSINEIYGFRHASYKEKSYLAKYLTVIISGIYEESIRTIITEWVSKRGSPEIGKFVNSAMEYWSMNPNIEKIVKILNKFDNQWGREIIQLPQKNKDAINSIVGQKNNIAHGRPSSITLVDIKDYFDNSRCVIEKIDEIVLP